MISIQRLKDRAAFVGGCFAVSQLLGEIQAELPGVIVPTSGKKGEVYTYVNGHGRLLLPEVVGAMLMTAKPAIADTIAALRALDVQFDDSEGGDVLIWKGLNTRRENRAKSGRFAVHPIPPRAPRNWSSWPVFQGVVKVHQRRDAFARAAEALPASSAFTPSNWHTLRNSLRLGMEALSRMSGHDDALAKQMRSIRDQLQPSGLFRNDPNINPDFVSKLSEKADFFITCACSRYSAWICAADESHESGAGHSAAGDGAKVPYRHLGRAWHVSPGNIFGVVYLDHLEDWEAELVAMKAKKPKKPKKPKTASNVSTDDVDDPSNPRDETPARFPDRQTPVLSLSVPARSRGDSARSIESTLKATDTEWTREINDETASADWNRIISDLLMAIAEWEDEVRTSSPASQRDAVLAVQDELKRHHSKNAFILNRALCGSIYAMAAKRCGCPRDLVDKAYQRHQASLMSEFKKTLTRRLKKVATTASDLIRDAIDKAMATKFGASAPRRLEADVAFEELLRRIGRKENTSQEISR